MIQPDPAAQLDVRFFYQRPQSRAFRIGRTIIHADLADFFVSSELSLAEWYADFRGHSVFMGLRVEEAILGTSLGQMRYPSSMVNAAKVCETQSATLPPKLKSVDLLKQFFHRRLTQSCFCRSDDDAPKVDFLPLKVTTRFCYKDLRQLYEP